MNFETGNSIFSAQVTRKHLLINKTYNLYIFTNALVLSENSKLKNPKYVIPFDLETQILWKQENSILTSFGLTYQNKVKWFSMKNAELFKCALGTRFFFGNISLFYDAKLVIGQGASSKVCIVLRKSDSKKFASKCISKQYLFQKKNSDRINRLYSEISILQRLDHPSILKLHEIYQGENSYYLVSELLEGGTLYKFIKYYPAEQLPDKIVIIIMKQILNALLYLENQKIIHRDIKLENILFAIKNDITTLKIIDFGLAIDAQKDYRYCLCGTPGYIAPEILINESSENSSENFKFTYKNDIFSAGVIFYKLLTKKNLFQAEKTADLLEINKKCQISINCYNLNADAEDLLKRMIEPDPSKRFTAQQALNHKYLESICDQSIEETKDSAKEFKLIQTLTQTQTKHSTKIYQEPEDFSLGEEDQAAEMPNLIIHNQKYSNVNSPLRKKKVLKSIDDNQLNYMPSFGSGISIESCHSHLYLGKQVSEKQGNKFYNKIFKKLIRQKKMKDDLNISLLFKILEMIVNFKYKQLIQEYFKIFCFFFQLIKKNCQIY